MRACAYTLLYTSHEYGVLISLLWLMENFYLKFLPCCFGWTDYSSFLQRANPNPLPYDLIDCDLLFLKSDMIEAASTLTVNLLLARIEYLYAVIVSKYFSVRSTYFTSPVKCHCPALFAVFSLNGVLSAFLFCKYLSIWKSFTATLLLEVELFIRIHQKQLNLLYTS